MIGTLQTQLLSFLLLSCGSGRHIIEGSFTLAFTYFYGRNIAISKPIDVQTTAIYLSLAALYFCSACFINTIVLAVYEVVSDLEKANDTLSQLLNSMQEGVLILSKPSVSTP